MCTLSPLWLVVILKFFFFSHSDTTGLFPRIRQPRSFNDFSNPSGSCVCVFLTHSLGAGRFSPAPPLPPFIMISFFHSPVSSPPLDHTVETDTFLTPLPVTVLFAFFESFHPPHKHLALVTLRCCLFSLIYFHRSGHQFQRSPSTSGFPRLGPSSFFLLAFILTPFRRSCLFQTQHNFAVPPPFPAERLLLLVLVISWWARHLTDPFVRR